MSIAHSHLKAAVRILSGHDGKTPFPDHARAYFRVNRQHGGRDRRSILTLCYASLRMGGTLTGLGVDLRIVAGLFLTLDAPDRMLQELDASLNSKLPMPLEDRLNILKDRYPAFDPGRIFPWGSELGGNIDAAAFSRSHLIQPDLFVRLRPGREKDVLNKLDGEGMSYDMVGTSALRLGSGSDLAKLFTADRELVVQDLSSQRVGELMKGCPGVSDAWDCCAGSGGKTILLHDIFPDARISASDIRPSILNNLRSRLEVARINGVTTFPVDLVDAAVKGHGPFDMILADVPCTGSGTWGRNPEWLTCFDPSTIASFAARQKVMAWHASQALKPGGYFLYITCSVFRAENEEVVEYLQRSAGLKLEEMRYLTGYLERADSLFAARLTSPA